MKPGDIYRSVRRQLMEDDAAPMRPRTSEQSLVSMGPYAGMSEQQVRQQAQYQGGSRTTPPSNDGNYLKGYLSGWPGMVTDAANALTSFATAGIPDQNLRARTREALTLPGTDDFGRMMGGDPESDAFQAGTFGIPGVDDAVAKAPHAVSRFLEMVDPTWAMTLFHGTPHKFDKFDLSKMGTGEGAQSFGWGLYFAENPKVAGQYATNLGQFDRVGINSLDIAPMPGVKVSESAHMNLDEYFDLTQGDGLTQSRYDEAIADMQSRIDQYGENSLLSQSDVDELKRLSVNDFRPANGHLYEVDIPDEVVDQMLDWDAPLSEQPESVQKALNQLRRPMPMSMGDLAGMTDAEAEAAIKAYKQSGKAQKTMQVPPLDPNAMVDTGRSYYEKLSRQLGGDKQASEFLNQAGIPGIRFYDGGSRAKGEGTRNIVVFDPDSTIRTVKRDGELVYEQTPKPVAKRAAGQGIEAPPRYDYPPVPEPEHKVDPKSGKEYLGKGTSDETADFLKRRRIAQKDIDAGNYEPYFNPHERHDAAGYDPAADTTQYARPKKEATVQKWREKVQTDDARQRLQAAFDAGVQSGGHDRWYQVGQLQKAFIDELGPEEGAKRFDEFFAQAMAATTGGADPTSNLMMAHFGNYRRAQGLPADVPAYEMPVPIGGRYASGNLAMYERVLGADGAGLDPSGHPKRHNFAANFRGDRNLVTVDEQMTGLITPELKAPPNNSYFAYEELIREMAEKNGVDPREFQEVAWGGKKWTDTGGKYQGKSMIEHVNEAVERTSRLTGMTPDEVVKGIIHGNRMLGNARTDLLTLLGGGAAAAAVGANLLDTEEKRK